MSVIDDDPEYAAALALSLLGEPLDERQTAALEAGRLEAGYPPGRYPFPSLIADRLPGPSYVDRPTGPHRVQPRGPRHARHERHDPTVGEYVLDATGGRAPVCPLREFRPDPE